jgi:hypothetical protein
MIRTLALASTFALALTGAAFAHAHLKSSTPTAGSTLAAAPKELDLTFTEDLNLKFSGLELTGPDKKVVLTGQAMLMDKDTTLMVPVMGALPRSIYTVAWHALSKDGHKTSGTFAFTVKP